MNTRPNKLSFITVNLLHQLLLSLGKDGTPGREDPPLHQGEAGGAPGQGGVQLLGGQVNGYLYRSNHPGAAILYLLIHESAIN